MQSNNNNSNTNVSNVITNNQGGNMSQDNTQDTSTPSPLRFAERIRLAFHEQEANYNHLISIIKGATTYTQLKSVWLERNKLETQFKQENDDKPCWLMSKWQNDIILEAYNNRKHTDFATEVAAELADARAHYETLKQEIVSCKTLEELHLINRAIYRMKKSDLRINLKELSAKAYQELLQLSA